MADKITRADIETYLRKLREYIIRVEELSNRSEGVKKLPPAPEFEIKPIKSIKK